MWGLWKRKSVFLLGNVLIGLVGLKFCVQPTLCFGGLMVLLLGRSLGTKIHGKEDMEGTQHAES